MNRSNERYDIHYGIIFTCIVIIIFTILIKLDSSFNNLKSGIVLCNGLFLIATIVDLYFGEDKPSKKLKRRK
jgi:hypothetical protein